ncbi:DUF1611 domain-containing protein [Ktedonosporobacter rubrisoli]|uniref:DUF1611 domain-containing protein n=1 Tax=Ktedonosporobacter rubrisoli TaxID=2509675 RepID=UPI001A912680|nr:DUF1611 domain-containing protein [Ktedonosporobacter rubrisoli]
MVQDIHEALTLRPDTLLIGIAPMGGALPETWRWQILAAIEAGLDIISGLHVFLSEDPELSVAAAKRGVKIWDVRRPPEQKRVAQFVPHRAGSHTVLMVGSDCSTGKMTVALELDKAAQKRGLSSAFLATGQTGIMISNRGLPADRLISDFIAGMVEEMTLDLAEKHDWVFVEGQGALNHPGYAPVTLGLVHGSNPDAMIFCHVAGTTCIDGLEHVKFPSLQRLIEINEEAISWIRPDRSCKVAGISLVTYNLTEEQAHDEIKRIEDEMGLPTTDPIRFGADKLLDALVKHFAA